LATYDTNDGTADHVIAATATGSVQSAVSNDILGSSGNDVLSGGSGDNVIKGNGGQDIINAGSGNDSIVLNASNVTALAQTGGYIDGGTGTDTLVLDGTGITLNFASLQSKVVGIEKIDLTGSGNNTLQLSLADVIAVSDTPNLYVTGNAGDNVQIKGTSVTPTATTVSGVAYNDYNLDGTHHLYVQQAVTAVFVA
jgi:Ca2+-binding RTX toxin-like protein